MNLDKNAYDILAQLLKMAGNEFSNHTSNDFDLPNTPENRAFMEKAELWNSGPNGEPFPLNFSKDGTYIFTSNAFLMDYFAHLAQEAAKGN